VVHSDVREALPRFDLYELAGFEDRQAKHDVFDQHHSRTAWSPFVVVPEIGLRRDESMIEVGAAQQVVIGGESHRASSILEPQIQLARRIERALEEVLGHVQIRQLAFVRTKVAQPGIVAA